MILGIGVDLIEFKDFLRIYNFLKKRKLFRSIFFKEELIFKNDYKKLAGICALKEAVYKTMSPYLIKGTLFKNIKIIKSGSGKITVEVSQKYFLPSFRKKFFLKKKSKINFFCSLSYSSLSVIAICVAEINFDFSE